MTLTSSSAELTVLIVGSGGREHALAWKLAQSPRLKRLICAPGNPGMAQLGETAPVADTHVPALVELACREGVDLVVIGPEAALAAGLSDALHAANPSTGARPAVFGPSQAAARIESSKAFSKAFMRRHAIPTADFAVFTELQPALDFLERAPYPVVIKASGLAAGKGVLLPESRAEAQTALREMLVEGRFGAAGAEVIIEERLSGEEVSLLAFCDGQTVVPMPAAQDHKRLLDGDQGPNTGGMGAYAPAPVCTPELRDQIVREVLQPTVDGLRAEGCPFVGVLYAGMILTAAGPRVLEFNARFGDPETQAILPLLDSDLLEILLACTQGRLDRAEVRWKDAAAACVVLASAGYPEHPAQPTPIHGLDALPQDSVVFQAGTRAAGGRVLASGGRVLGVTATAGALPDAVQAAYRAVSALHFAGAQYRRDIAARALRTSAKSGGGAEARNGGAAERSSAMVERSSTSEAPGASASAYRKAGVDIDAGNRAVDLLRASVTSTYDARVIKGVGSFGGLFDAAQMKTMQHPVLVSSTDGVGTKVKLAAALGRCRGVGMDIVNHCIDDILVHGARPLFFLDYFAAAHLDPERVAEIVDGMAEACRAAGCVLIGGETAEMPGVYAAGEFDIAGTIVGCLERDRLLPRAEIRPGDRLIGLRSSGPHTNGYSLLRSIFAEDDLNAPRADLDGASLADALLAPHRSYLNLLRPVLDDPRAPLLGIAHITGGGFIENLPRILPEGVGVRIQAGSWPVPPLFRLAQQRGAVADAECYRVFNMGIGLVLVVRPEDAAAVQAAIPEPTWVIGETVAWNAAADSQPRVEVR